ncbi:hypothetical protein Trydic_g17713 [Trypoxylus dichotomus]
MFSKVVLATLALLVFNSVLAENSIKCSRILDETFSRGGELCFYPHKVQFTEHVRGKNMKFNFPLEDFKDTFAYKTDEKMKLMYDDYYEVK